MTGEQLYDGWVRAGWKLGFIQPVQAPNWPRLQSTEQFMWNKAAFACEYSERMNLPLTREVFLKFFGNNWLNSVSPKITAVADELVNNWATYFGGFNFSGHDALTAPSSESDHQKGDVWVFRAGKSRAVVVDVDGRMVKLRLNRIDTDWISVDELMKDAEKEVK